MRVFFCKKTALRLIWAVHALDPTAEIGRRRGHVSWPSFGAIIVRKRCVPIGPASTSRINRGFSYHHCPNCSQCWQIPHVCSEIQCWEIRWHSRVPTQWPKFENFRVKPPRVSWKVMCLRKCADTPITSFRHVVTRLWWARIFLYIAIASWKCLLVLVATAEHHH